MVKKTEVFDRIKDLGLVAVIRGPSYDLTMEMVAVLVSAGIKGIEITFTTPDALEVVKDLNQKYQEDILLGMGTVTQPEQASKAADAGARFLVSPHLNQELTKAMKKTGLLTIVGALTPSEIHRAFYDYQVDIVKVFPGSLVGPSYFEALRGPLPDLLLMPSGGVNLENLQDWLSAGATVVGLGGGMFPRRLIENKELDEITSRAKKCLEILNNFRQSSPPE
jgi:2-dehydro-3-deoxyphosphogluconate aldolase/(4S)-4-hydroxy-2-oxoglutarate aldolase